MKVDEGQAKQRVADAYRLANGSSQLPTEWTERFERLASERTYTAILATALLARSVSSKAEPRILMVRAGPQGYSARHLFTHVIFEECKRLDVPLGTIGREPHNNQPFFGNAQIDEVVRGRVDPGRLPTFDSFVESIDAVGQLSPAQALAAFASFLRFRLRVNPRVRVELEEGSYDLSAIRRELGTFLRTGVEGGRRGEAFVAACLDLWYEHVSVNVKANDPSRHLPGDVGVFKNEAAMRSFDPSAVIFLAEVKEREASDGEILQFAENVAAQGVRRAAYFLLSPRQPSADFQSVADGVWRRHGVSVAVFAGAGQVLADVITLADIPLDEAIAGFVRQMAHRLEEKEAQGGLGEWLAFVDRLKTSAPEH